MKQVKNWILGGLLAVMLAGTATASLRDDLQNLQEGLDAYNAGDYTTAFAKFAPLAHAGNAQAQFTLGTMYYKGNGVPQNDVKSAKWHHRAAEAGHASAQFTLGTMYATGKGVKQDNRISYMWLDLATGQGHKLSVEIRDVVANLMTPAQLTEAKKMSRQCLKQNYKNCEQLTP